MIDTKNMLIRKQTLQKYHTLTKTDKEGKPLSGATRTLSPEEAVGFLYGHLSPSNAQNYINLVDKGVSPQKAYSFAKSNVLTARALFYMQNISSTGLYRMLTPEESLYAVYYKGDKEKMLRDIDAGRIKIPTEHKLDVQK